MKISQGIIIIALIISGCSIKIKPGDLAQDDCAGRLSTYINTVSCELYDEDGNFIETMQVQPNRIYCELQASYVKCFDGDHEPVWASTSGPLCPFIGDTPECPQVLPGAVPTMVIE